MAPQQSQLATGVRVGDYQLLRLLGRGGMGDVWLASDLRADRQVALKFIKPHFLDDPALRTRFLNEAKTLGRLEHDRIVTLYNVVEEGPWLALVLRFIDGNSLADRIDAQGVLPVDFFMASVRDILPALGFAHDRGVIHRDMKPQNILVDKQDRSFLTDFGIAVGDFAERGTVTGFAVGTPHYMSPEQIQTPRQITVHNGGHRSDIYSYGVVLYEMLTGRVPFCGDSGTEEMYRVQHAHCVEPPPPLRDVNPNVSPALEEVVLRCLAKGPDERPQTCAELLREIETAVHGGAVAARPVSARQATVVERSLSASPSQAKPVAVQPQAAKPVVSIPRRGIPKTAWLGMGVLLIAGGVSWAILSSKGGAPQTVTPKTSTPVAIQDPPRQAGDSGGSTSPPRTASNGIVTPPIRPAVTLPNAAGTTAPIQPAANIPNAQLAAERAYTQALDLSNKGQFCDGKDPIDQAVKLGPGNPKYTLLQRSLAQRCDALTKNHEQAQNNFEQANLQFQQGNYCEGKSAIDEALKLDPANAQYKDLQQRLAKGCRLQ